MLGDVNLELQVRQRSALTSITSYTYRDVLVVRDADGADREHHRWQHRAAEKRLHARRAAERCDDGESVDAGAALRRRPATRFPGSPAPSSARRTGTTARICRSPASRDLTGIPTRGLRAPKDTLFFSDLGYKLNQFALFGEGTFGSPTQFSLTGGLRFYHFSEDKEQIFDGIFAQRQHRHGARVAARLDRRQRRGAPCDRDLQAVGYDANLNGQVSRGFRLGGINDPLNVPLCTPQDLVTFGGRDTWKDEKVWNYEVGVKSSVLNGKGAFSVAGFYLDISDLQATVTAGSCSSRVVFNVPKARSAGVEVEFEAAPNRNIDFAISSDLQRFRAALDAHLDGRQRQRQRRVGHRRRAAAADGARVPARDRRDLPVGGQPERWSYMTGTYQHIGSRFTQVGDEDLGTLDLLSFGANTIGGPLTASTFTYDPELPAYDLLNLRAGVRRNAWDVSVFINNVTDERALLSLDHERGTRARIGYLTNQPRTFGLSTRLDF